MDEDYHGTGAKGPKKKNIFDEDVSEDAARNMFKSSHYEFDVHYTADPELGEEVVHDHQSKSHLPAPDLTSLATPASRVRPAPENKTMSNSASFGGASRAIEFGHNRSQSLTVAWNTQGGSQFTPLSTKNAQKSDAMLFSSSSSLQSIDKDPLLQEKKLGDWSSPSSSLQSVDKLDVEKMQQEIQSLKRSLLSARKDRWMKLPVEDTLRRILKGEVFSLEMYKSLADKLCLLDQAIALHDGNAIMTAVLFLQRTVTRHIFTKELVKRPVAASHYLTYLKAHFEFPEYINTLIMLGRTEEAAIFKYQQTLPTADVSVKISKLNDCLRGHFQSDPVLSHDASLVQESVDLLERQRPIDESDANLEASGRSALFRDFPRKRSLIGMPVVTTLYYCCLYHYDLGENSLASPAALRKKYQISDKQFTRTAIGARAKLRQWKDIEAILTTKGWFGGTKLKAPIGFDKIVGILHKNGAPPDILQKYLAMVDNLELRLNLAKKVSCQIAVIDALVALKNRAELEQLASKLDRYSKEGLYAFDVLNTSTIKWK
ncbi:spermatogenesis-defective protein 39 homolog [Plakobranchus ocellatus]|uniref:Spermatogenesis-defective protein 39 homolog n=1 Tax=Plakobranchus ocellatus TaxID=259542 RepID=A0AAV4AW16_9GAST|nr:spermatogenesis-defective protein 39 homolog [Plakobranchus ocellatus]